MNKYIDKHWVDEVWQKLEKKISVTSERSKNKIPYTTKDGVHDDRTADVSWWTNGFWAALMWLMYDATGDKNYKETAKISEEILDCVLYDYEQLTHDVGFMWHISAGVNYLLTGNTKSRKRNLMAASALASRYNTDGGFIRAWNDKGADGWSIIDCMMNIPLLYWASDEMKDPRFRQIAIHHANKTLANHIRPDGSLIHVVEYDVNNGEFLSTPSSQGYAPESSCWSRGQAWAIYGFVLSYIHTEKPEYLDAAKKCAHYFISAVCTEDYIPRCDFRQPDEPDIIDTTAGAIAACGLIELAKIVPEYEKKLYIKAAMNILKALEEKHCNWTLEEDSILQNGTENYRNGIHMPIIYGDYYFAEAIYKLKGKDKLFW